MWWDRLAIVPYFVWWNLRSIDIMSHTLSGDPTCLACVGLTGYTLWSRGLRRVAAMAVLWATIKSRMDSSVWAFDSAEDLAGRVAVITGANSGMGLFLARDLASRGVDVILACRSMSKCEAVVPEGGRCMHLDIANLSSVSDFAERLDTDRIDFLVNNAGVMIGDGHRTAEGFEIHWGTMHLGHFLLTRLLLPRLTAGDGEARIVNHASIAMTGGTVDYLDGDGRSDLRGEVTDGCPSSFAEVVEERGFCPVSGSYSRAKLAQVMFTVELQRRLDAAGLSRRVVTSSLHPGIVETGMVPITDLISRPTTIGTSVLLYCLLGNFTPGSFVDDSFTAHDLAGERTEGLYSLPVSSYKRVGAAALEKKLWQLSDDLLQEHVPTLPPPPLGWGESLR